MEKEPEKFMRFRPWLMDGMEAAPASLFRLSTGKSLQTN